MDISKQFEVIKIIHKWKLFKRVASLPKFTPRSSHAILSYYNKSPVYIVLY